VAATASPHTDEVFIDASSLSLREANAKIREAVEKGLKVRVANAKHIHGLAAGLRRGEVVVEGDVGDYFAMLNHGAKLLVRGSAGSYLFDGSWGGEVVVEGCAGDLVGVYAYGGVVVVKGRAGSGVGQLLKGATVFVGKGAGDLVGSYMVGGVVVVAGDAGELVGDWMVRGTIYVAGYKSLGHNAKEEGLSESDKALLSALLEKYGVDALASDFKKIVPVSSRPFYGKKEGA